MTGGFPPVSIERIVPVPLVERGGIGGGHIEVATPAGGDTTDRGRASMVTLADGWTRPGSAPFRGGRLPGHVLSAGPGDPVVRQRTGEAFRRIRHVRSFAQSELAALVAEATLAALAEERSRGGNTSPQREPLRLPFADSNGGSGDDGLPGIDFDTTGISHVGRLFPDIRSEPSLSESSRLIRGGLRCSICMRRKISFQFENCPHTSCKTCTKRMWQARRSPHNPWPTYFPCHLCRAKITHVGELTSWRFLNFGESFEHAGVTSYVWDWRPVRRCAWPRVLAAIAFALRICE